MGRPPQLHGGAGHGADVSGDDERGEQQSGGGDVQYDDVGYGIEGGGDHGGRTGDTDATVTGAVEGDPPLIYTLNGPAGAAPPTGLSYTPSGAEEAHGGVLGGVSEAVQAATPYTLTVMDADGDPATLLFRIEVVRIPVLVTIATATAAEGRPMGFAVTLSRAVSQPITLR